MESTQPDTEHVIPRYLAGQLSARESEEFERALSERADLCDETEQVLKFKEGLTRLRERGELDELLRARSVDRWLSYAAAAAVVIFCLATLVWFYLPRGSSTVLALSPGQFASGHPAPPVLGTYVLARTRGSTATAEVTRAGLVELRILPSVLSPTIAYRAQVRHLEGAGGGRSVAQIDAGSATADGYVTLYLDSSQLQSGEYEILLAPASSAGVQAEGDQFTLRVR
jgi:hypothetical protein